MNQNKKHKSCNDSAECGRTAPAFMRFYSAGRRESGIIMPFGAYSSNCYKCVDSALHPQLNVICAGKTGHI
ncbi:hypothetical protein ER57_17260 [Smithella sp. SCADC]|nr:hypothetical protein ER57_17260 [Smithella sp. SCADC]